MGKPKAPVPKTPDYAGAARSQTAGSVQAAIAANRMANPDIYTPLGSRTSRQTGAYQVPGIGGEPGYAIPTYARDIRLSPEQEDLYRRQTGLQSGLLGLGQGALERTAQSLNQPIGPFPQGVPQRPQAPPQRAYQPPPAAPRPTQAPQAPPPVAQPAAGPDYGAQMNRNRERRRSLNARRQGLRGRGSGAQKQRLAREIRTLDNQFKSLRDRRDTAPEPTAQPAAQAPRQPMPQAAPAPMQQPGGQRVAPQEFGDRNAMGQAPRMQPLTEQAPPRANTLRQLQRGERGDTGLRGWAAPPGSGISFPGGPGGQTPMAQPMGAQRPPMQQPMGQPMAAQSMQQPMAPQAAQRPLYQGAPRGDMYDVQSGISRDLLGTGVSSAAQARRSLEQPFNAQSLIDLSNQAYQQQTARLDPQWQQNEAQQRQMLANQGLTPGTEGYDNAMRVFNQQKNDAYTQARRSADDTMTRNFLLEAARRGQPLQELSNLQRASMETLPQTYQMDIARRMQPLTELNAILSGTQPQMPQFQPVQYQGVQGPNLLGAAERQGAYERNLYNQQMGARNVWTQGLFGLGGAVAGMDRWN